jgi:hypothetical protein
MKSSVFSKFMMLAFALALATSAFAAKDTYKGTFRISDPTQVNGKQLPAGDYIAKWEGTGPSVQVDIISDGKVVMTVPAQFVNLEDKASASSSEVHTGTSGNKELSIVRFSGKKYALNMTGQAAQASMGSGDSAK